MRPQLIIKGKKVGLSLLMLEQVTDRYASWMNDIDVVRFLHSNVIDKKKYDVEELKKWVSAQKNLYGIYDLDHLEHIGNVKLNISNDEADVGFLIGEKQYWGMGIGKEAVGLCVFGIGRDILHLKRIFGGAAIENVASNKIFEGLGFKRAGEKMSDILLSGKYRKILEWEILL